MNCPFCGFDLNYLPCPECSGLGFTTRSLCTSPYHGSQYCLPCGTCGGTGRLPSRTAMQKAVVLDCKFYHEAWKELADE